MTHAIVMQRTGVPAVLKLKDLTLARPAADQVQVRITAIGVNFIETYQRSGLYPVKLPYIPGGEMCGVVAAVGRNVKGFAPGERVATGTAGSGCYAEVANVAASRLVKVPKAIPDEVAAAGMLKGMTAQYLLRQVYKVGKGDTILVHAAAGGVGLLMGQWANALGATVIGTVSSKAKAKLAKANGYHHVIDYSQQDFVKEVHRLTKGALLPVVYDSVGAATFPASLDCLQKFGLFVSYGNASGPVPPFSPILLSQKGSLFMTRPTLFDFVRTPELLNKVAGDVFKAMKDGTLKISINQRYPLAQAAQAHADLEARKTTGSTLLIP